MSLTTDTSAAKKNIALAFFIILFIGSAHSEDEITYSQNNLLELLAANFARHRQAPESALHYYLSQAKTHQSAALAAQAVQYALAIKDKDALKESTDIWLKVAPSNPRAVFFSAISNAFNNQPEAAILLMQQAEAYSHVTDYTWLAQLLNTSNKMALRQAIKRLDFSAEEHNTNYDAMIARALLLAHTDSLNSIPALLEKAMQLGSFNPTVFALSGDIYQTLGQLKNARFAYEKGALMHPQQISLRFKLAVLTQSSDPKTARMHYEMLNLQAPGTPFILKNLATLYLSSGEHKKAKQLFHKLTAFPTYLAFAKLQLANIATKEDDCFLALSLLHELPQNLSVQATHLRVINQLITKGAITQAQKHIKKRLKRTTHKPYIIALKQLNIASLMANKRHKKALKNLTRYISQHPNHLHFSTQSALLAAQLYTPKRFDKHLHMLIKNNAHKTELLKQLGQKIAVTNQGGTQIKQQLTRILSLSPKNPILLDSYGWLLYRMGQLEDAAFWVSKALNYQPNAQSAVHLGEILWALGDKEQAKRIFSKAAELTPDDRELNNTLERLNISFVSKSYP